MPLGEDPDPEWAQELVETVAAGMSGSGLRGEGQPGLPGLPGSGLLPGARARRAGDPVTSDPGTAPAQLARLLGVAEPTAEQAAVIARPPGPMAVIAGAGSGKSETMAARLVWLVANGLVRPERVLGLTFTRKAAAELAERVRVRLDGLRALVSPAAALVSPVAPARLPPPTAAAPPAGTGATRRARHRRGPPARTPPMTCSATRSSPPITPTPGGSSPTTRCGRRWSHRCG